MAGTLRFMPVMPLVLLSAVTTALALASVILIITRGEEVRAGKFFPT
jgi:hypothetical protein